MFVRQYPDAGSSWITTVRGSTFPINGPSSTTNTTTSMVSITSESGNCAGVSVWLASVGVSPAQPHLCTHCSLHSV
ncbi:hypothetical protein J3R83DRAFT_9258 [Lanmaoa asiatica]|nr:hypothetical protein J3R83DRAFT_9258 [Lanmaoa asiatica]